MRSSETTPIERSATSLQGPEFRNLHQMGFPVLDLRIEDRTQHLMLSNIHVEGTDEFQDSFMPAHTHIERWARIS